ncbi:hypothetical protein B0H11DRAFT_2087938 [Mycena galericulata]|nr:hypothetical protein B0H11DRAFT_2087938 [Mycena galericulata]
MPEPESAAERTTRGGRVFNPYVLRNAIFVPRRRIFDLVKQRAEGESDSESDTDDDEGDAPEGLQSVHDVDSRKSAKGKRKARGDPPTSSPGPSKRPRNATREDLELEASAPAHIQRSVCYDRVPAPLVDEDRYVFAVLAGAPRDPKWQQDEAAQEIYGEPFYAEVFGRRLTPASEKDPRRGSHHSKNVGSSMGGGPDEPTAFYNSVINTLILAQLLAARPFQRIAGFINKMFHSYSPDLHDHYRTTMAELHRWKDGLPRNFSALTSSVFAAATFNFGPRTVTLPHLDFANLAWGWCSITALGYFDPNKGGHLILWDLRLVIRFPPGSSILIPSAILRHSNVAIQQGEKRFSFTQYTAAGIFRFVGNGFRTEKSLNARMTAAEQAKRAEERRCRFTEGIKMYKKWDVAFE